MKPWIEKAVKFDIGITSRRLLQRFCQSDVSISDIATLLRKNQAYKHRLSALCAKMLNPGQQTEESAKEFKPPAHRIVALLGPIITRNLVAGSRLYRIKNGKIPDLTVAEEKQKSMQLLKTALSIEDFMQSQKLPYAEIGFNCGIFIDLFDLIFESESWYKNEFKERPALISRVKKSIVLATQMSHFLPLPSNSLLAAAIFTQMSRLFAHQKEKGFSFKTVNRTYQAAREQEIYGYVPEDIMSLCLFYFQIFPETYKAVRFFREPYQLLGENKQTQQLAAVLQVMDYFVEDWKLLKDDKDPKLKQWINPSTNRIGVKTPNLLQAFEKSAKMNI